MPKNNEIGMGLVIGDKIEIKEIKNKTNNKYKSQLLDIVDENIFIVSGPIHKNVLIPLHVGSLVEITYIREGKGRFVFKAKIIERECKNIYRLKIEKISSIIKLQERNYYRLPVKLDVQKRHILNIKNDKKVIIEKCIGKDISGGGIKIICNYEHSENDLVDLDITVSDFHITVTGIVVRVEEIENNDYKYSIGIKFIDINDNDRERLIKYIFDEQRRLRQKGLI